MDSQQPVLDAAGLARVRSFIDGHEWHFAKTMPQIPHWYCLLKDKGDVEEFRWFAAYIRDHSVTGRFYGKTYYYFRFDGYKYWWIHQCGPLRPLRDDATFYIISKSEFINLVNTTDDVYRPIREGGSTEW